MRDDDSTGLRQWRILDWTFAETRHFTRVVVEMLSDDEYRALQVAIAARPEAGAVIPGCGGPRKLRWRAGGRGKRGGLRVIYLHLPRKELILLFDLFGKSERADLTAAQRNALRRLVEKEVR